MKKDVLILTGAGQIGMAITRRLGYGKKIIVGDKRLDNALAVQKALAGADFLIDGGAAGSYFYGPLRPKTRS